MKAPIDMQVSFHGGAREVTGACHLLETNEAKILVDCGLFQGSREIEDMNFEPFGFDPSAIDAVVITHAHIDHIGRLPRLVREGFHGPILSTAPTLELARVLLEDALHLAEREHKALFGPEDLEHTFILWEDMAYRTPRAIKDAMLTLHDAGHILGSAMAHVEAEGKRILFTGDLGNVPSVLLPPPDVIDDIDYLVIESAYGTRLHEAPEERVLKLERAVEDVVFRGGTLLVPAFATERTQDIIFLLNEMLHQKRIPQVPVYVDSPLAIRITEVYERHSEAYKEEIKELYRAHPHLFRSKELHFTLSVDESKTINDVRLPKVVVAGSGMMSGGRILHHARRYLPDPKSILLIIGYQASGSLGRRLVDGVKKVRIIDEEITVRAEIRQIGGFSAHADNAQLHAFVDSKRGTLKHVFVVQGEEEQALGFKQEIEDRLGIPASAPMRGEGFTL